MNARELRLGNIICHSANHQFEVSSMNDESVTAFDDDRFLDIRGASGIPLTEAWLLKFGFNSDLEMMVSVNYCKMIYRHEVWNFYNNDSDCVIATVKYVHQLQNLYFALTGEELTIKTT